MVGAAALALDELRSGAARERGRCAGRLIVCPTPIGNLEDVTLRVLAALREADVIACEDTRRTRMLLDRYGVSARAASATTSTTSASARPSWSSGCRRARSSRSSPTPACRSCPTRASCSCRRASPPGSRSRCCRGRRAALAALVASALPAERWRFAGFLPRKRGRAASAPSARPRRSSRSSRRERVAASLAVLAELDPERPVAVCRELTKLHEEVVRGTAAELAARYAAQAPRGEVVLVVGGAPARATPTLAPALDALRRLVEAGAKPRPAATVVAELTGVPANALYRALTDAQADRARWSTRPPPVVMIAAWRCASSPRHPSRRWSSASAPPRR